MIENNLQFEQQSLTAAKWANLVMCFAGIMAAFFSNANALMLDGLFSGLNFFAAIFAARVAKRVSQSADRGRPFGYAIEESMYTMFRSLVLTGILTLAALNALDGIYEYATGEVVPEIRLNWIMIYVVLMVVISGGLAYFHRRNWQKTGEQSEVLKTEQAAAGMDAALSAAAGAAFLAISLFKGTPLAFLVPISDSIVVLALVAYMIRVPIGSFVKGMDELLGVAVDRETVGKLTTSAQKLLTDTPFELIELAATRAGRSLFAVSFVRPIEAVDVATLDMLRADLHTALLDVSPNIDSEVVFTGKAPFANKSRR